MRAYFATGLDPKTLLVAEGNLTGMAYVELPTTAGHCPIRLRRIRNMPKVRSVGNIGARV
jgi:hypothetical protein